jgi:uncharacterized protein YdaU (DUF1376 family)
MAEFPALPLWTDAYLGDTTHLTTIEHGAYFLLLLAMWRTRDCSLPSDDRLLARYTRLTAGQWARIKPVIMPFFDVSGDRITQGRLTDEAKLVRQNSKKASDAARARWLKDKETGDADAGAKQSGRSAPTPTPTPTPTEDSGAKAPLSAEPPLELTPTEVERDFERDAFDAYNHIAKRVGFPAAKVLNQTRRVSLRLRLKECGGLDGWAAALDKLEASSLCRGANDRGWVADFDFLLQAKSFTRLMEGRYDDRKPQRQPEHRPSTADVLDQLIEQSRDTKIRMRTEQ